MIKMQGDDAKAQDGENRKRKKQMQKDENRNAGAKRGKDGNKMFQLEDKMQTPVPQNAEELLSPEYQ